MTSTSRRYFEKELGAGIGTAKGVPADNVQFVPFRKRPPLFVYRRRLTLPRPYIARRLRPRTATGTMVSVGTSELRTGGQTALCT